jgi:hypothetical protein
MQQTEHRMLIYHSCIIFWGFNAQISARISAKLNEVICIFHQSLQANTETVT